MKGHEYPRALVRAMLAEQVPIRLAKIRPVDVDPAEWGEWPPDPKAYLLSDELPIKEEQYPAVLISSSTASVDSNLQAGLGEFIYEYAVTISAVVVANRHGGQEQSSVGRDRILLAIREALHLNAELAPDCYAVVRSAQEETGKAIENPQSKAMSLGNISLVMRVIEELTDPLTDNAGDPAVITTHTEIVNPVDASMNLP